MVTDTKSIYPVTGGLCDYRGFSDVFDIEMSPCVSDSLEEGRKKVTRSHSTCIRRTFIVPHGQLMLCYMQIVILR